MNTRTLVAGTLGLALVACTVWSAPGDIVELTCKSATDAAGFAPVTAVALEPLANAPRSLKGRPKFASSKPLYFELKLGPARSSYLLALDEGKGNGQGYDRLYVDADRDRDLSNDPPVEGTCTKGRGYSRGEFSGAKALVTHGGERVPWHFAARYTSYDDDGRGRISLSVSCACYCEGTVDLGGKQVKLAVVDVDSNGCFNDLFSLPASGAEKDSFNASGDWLLADADGDGRFAMSSMGMEACGLGRYLLYGGEVYQVKVSSSGLKLSVAPAQVPCGSLAREGTGPFFAALLTRSNGMLGVQGTGEAVKLPAGAYKLYLCSFEVKEGTGDAWKVNGEGTPAGPAIHVSPGNKPTTAKFGTPLAVGASVKVYPSGSLNAVKPGTTLRMDLDIKGQGSETYSASSITRAGRRLEPPAVKILYKNDKLVASGSFRYG